MAAPTGYVSPDQAYNGRKAVQSILIFPGTRPPIPGTDPEIYYGGAGVIGLANGALAAQATAGIIAGTTQTQSGATQLSGGLNSVDTNATAGNGVALPVSAAGLATTVINNTTKSIQVYPAVADTGATINGVAAATGVPQLPGAVVTYRSAVAGAWLSEFQFGLSAGLPLQQTVSGVTAHSGGGQANAVAITAQQTQVSTVAADHDSVILPPSAAGMLLLVANAGAHILDIYAHASETINAIAALSPISPAAGKNILFFCPIAGNWYGILTA